MRRRNNNPAVSAAEIDQSRGGACSGDDVIVGVARSALDGLEDVADLAVGGGDVWEAVLAQGGCDERQQQ